MTEATRKALNQIDQMLHEAGWDEVPSAQESSAGTVDVARLRHAYETLLSHDHLDILQAMLGEHMTVEQFAEKLGTNEARRRLRGTLHRLRDFVDSCGGLESAPVSEETFGQISD
jgi:hypothetical protein